MLKILLSESITGLGWHFRGTRWKLAWWPALEGEGHHSPARSSRNGKRPASGEGQRGRWAGLSGRSYTYPQSRAARLPPLEPHRVDTGSKRSSPGPGLLGVTRWSKGTALPCSSGQGLRRGARTAAAEPPPSRQGICYPATACSDLGFHFSIFGLFLKKTNPPTTFPSKQSATHPVPHCQAEELMIVRWWGLSSRVSEDSPQMLSWCKPAVCRSRSRVPAAITLSWLAAAHPEVSWLETILGGLENG